MNSRNKGKKGELELSHKLQEYGYGTRRGQQYCGIEGNADVVGLPGIHIEAKRHEQLRLSAWMKQAQTDAEKFHDGIPTVFHRKNREPWLVTMSLEDFMQVYEHFVNKGQPILLNEKEKET